MIAKLVDDFRKGKVNPSHLRSSLEDGLSAFDLQSAVGVRTSLMKDRLEFSSSDMSNMAHEVEASKLASKRIGLDVLPNPQTVIPKTDEDDHWVSRDDLKTFDDVCTKFCTKRYFPDAFARVNMIGNVVSLFTEAAKAMPRHKYKILFKGGVMIRLVLIEWLHDMPSETRDSFLEYISSKQKSVGISDFDFEISPSDESPREEVVRRMTLFNYLVLLGLQQTLEAQLEGRVPSTLVNTSWDREEGAAELKESLQAEVDSLSDSHPMRGCTIDHVVLSGRKPSSPRSSSSALKSHRTKSGSCFPSPRDNFFIFKCRSSPREGGEADSTCVASASSVFRMLGVSERLLERAGSHLYCTYNSHIGEGEERKHADHLLGHFHLLRIKHTFVVFYTTSSGERRIDRLAGEMVDLSQSHGSEHDKTHAVLFRELARPYVPYSILSVGDFQMYSYSIEGFLTDHRFMLHHRDVPPWRVSKLEKRLLRYTSFLFCLVLGVGSSSSMPVEERLSSLRSLADAVARLPTSVSPRFSTPVRAVNSFYAREVRSLHLHGPRGAKSYYRTMHSHLSKLLSLCSDAHSRMLHPSWRPFSTLNPVHLEHTSEFYYSSTAI